MVRTCGPAWDVATVLGLLVVMLLVVAGYFLMTALRHESQLEDCMMAGRKNCAPLDIPTTKP